MEIIVKNLLKESKKIQIDILFIAILLKKIIYNITNINNYILIKSIVLIKKKFKH